MASELDELEQLRKLTTPGLPLASDSVAARMARVILAYVETGRVLGTEKRRLEELRALVHNTAIFDMLCMVRNPGGSLDRGALWGDPARIELPRDESASRMDWRTAHAPSIEHGDPALVPIAGLLRAALLDWIRGRMFANDAHLEAWRARDLVAEVEAVGRGTTAPEPDAPKGAP